jgi:hypothetical protein
MRLLFPTLTVLCLSGATRVHVYSPTNGALTVLALGALLIGHVLTCRWYERRVWAARDAALRDALTTLQASGEQYQSAPAYAQD